MKSKCCNSDIIQDKEISQDPFCSNCGDLCIIEKFTTIKIKPMSVNELYMHRSIRLKSTGKQIVQRIKTKKYRDWQNDVHCLLPSNLKFEGKLKLRLIIAYSSGNSDLDNGVKAIQDSLQTKYGFNDNKIFELEARKILVKKGNEYFSFNLEEI